MDDKTFYTLLVSILLAILGMAVKYWNDLRIAQRKDRLERVNLQLRDLYGPLYALDLAASVAWASFRSKYRPGGSFFGRAPKPTSEELIAWRLWMREVFMPLNLRMEERIVSQAHLVVGGKMPDCFIELCAHVAAYKTVLKRWDSGDFTDHVSVINYPVESLRRYVHESYFSLLAEQQTVLGRTQPGERDG